MRSVRFAALAAATAGTIMGAIISVPLWRAKDVYAYRRATAGAGDGSALFGMPVAFLVVPLAFALHRPGSSPDKENREGLSPGEATAATVLSIAGNWALWAALGAFAINRFRVPRQTD